MPEDEENLPIEPLNGHVSRSDSREDHQTVAEIAFSLWQERGCPEGSPEEDWYRAERLANGDQPEEVVQ